MWRTLHNVKFYASWIKNLSRNNKFMYFQNMSWTIWVSLKDWEAILWYLTIRLLKSIRKRLIFWIESFPFTWNCVSSIRNMHFHQYTLKLCCLKYHNKVKSKNTLNWSMKTPMATDIQLWFRSLWDSITENLGYWWR